MHPSVFRSSFTMHFFLLLPRAKPRRLPWLGAFALRLWEGSGAFSRYVQGGSEGKKLVDGNRNPPNMFRDFSILPTWRIISVSKWLVTTIYKPLRPFVRGPTTRSLGDLLTMVINHVSVRPGSPVLQVIPLPCPNPLIHPVVFGEIPNHVLPTPGLYHGNLRGPTPPMPPPPGNSRP